MNELVNNPAFSLKPVHFFEIAVESRFLARIKGKPFSLNRDNAREYLLPDLSKLNGGVSFAQISIGWSFEGIEFFVDVTEGTTHSPSSDPKKGNSFEVCIDTRKSKAEEHSTQFCHHFLAVPHSASGAYGKEITKFRSYDARPLFNADQLQIDIGGTKREYWLHFFIPASSLHGYDPELFAEIGFSYCVNRGKREPQYFAVNGKEFAWEQNPALWSRVKLVKTS